MIHIPNKKQIMSTHPTLCSHKQAYEDLVIVINSDWNHGLGEPYVAYFLEHYLRTHPKTIKRIELGNYKKSKEYNELLKSFKKQAHGIYSVFLKTKVQKKEILYTHQSTLERLEEYESIKQQIQKIAIKQKIKVNKILDIGSGHNPFAYNLFLEKKQIKQYDTVEVSDSFAEKYEEFFAKEKIKHTSYVTHLPIYYNEVFNTIKTKYDICIAWKVFDTFEKQKRHSTVKMLQQINASILCASFSITTLSGSKMQREQAGWFHKVIRQLNLTLIDSFTTNNEIFYFVSLRNTD